MDMYYFQVYNDLIFVLQNDNHKVSLTSVTTILVF